MLVDIQAYHEKLTAADQLICTVLYATICAHLSQAEHKIWHAHPVWFLDGNPIVGYSKQKAGIRLMFWSGADFEEPDLNIKGEKFKDASVFYNHVSEIDASALKRWLEKAVSIQWDYKNLVKRKGQLVRRAD